MQHIAQGKRSDTLGTRVPPNVCALKGQKHKYAAHNLRATPQSIYVDMLLPFQGAITRGLPTQGAALGYVLAGLSARTM